MPSTSPDFDALFRDEYPRLVSAFSVALGPEMAADVVQEAFIRANVRWSKVKRLDRPGAWVRRVALNLITDHQRRLVRRRRIDPLLVERQEFEPRLLDVDLAAAIAALPERQRLAVSMHYLLDLPVAAVAAELSISEGTVKATLHHARQSLRAQLEVIDDVG